MWKATATLDQNTIKDTISKKQDELEDWDSDPNFTNAISEKDQRWGRQETVPKEDSSNQDPIPMHELRKQVVEKDKEISQKEWNAKAEAVKKSYQNPSKIK